MAKNQKRPSNGRKRRPVAPRYRTRYPMSTDGVWDVLDATIPLREHAN